ncbi:hypothetical protein RPATATE_0033 [Rickettsia parkeri str. Tate's Hell]|uniref:Uncharacterized protein n=1 Tax=Rickettsia parkeri str. Tate's Hell TaxID=1359189 RepID=A0ABR5DRN8_RICPA|nr:hypothetical protein RPAAT24_0889 [Rickettsia parkeri str. AT\
MLLTVTHKVLPAWIPMSFPQQQESRKNSLSTNKINLKKQIFCRFYWIPASAGMTSRAFTGPRNNAYSQ